MSRSPACDWRVTVLLLMSVSPLLGQSGLSPWSENPWYWSWHGEPVLLLGGSDDDNLFQWPQETLLPQLDRIVAAGGNVVRNTMSDRKDGGFEVYPFLQRADGKYDLQQWNPEYWRRFDRFLTETAKRRIVVQIEIWDRFDFTDVRPHDPKRWESHPYNPLNNINYTFAESGFRRRYPEHPGQNKQAFFFTTPKQKDNRVVRRFQERFVERLLSSSLKHDHVLYCIDNETRADAAWGEYWAQFIKRKAAEDRHRVMVTEMWDDWDLKAARHRQTFDHPELYDFVDVSQNNQNSGQKHWDNFLFVRDYLATEPRPMNTTKTYGADGNKFRHTDQDALERFWRHLLAGAASARFHRPPSGLGIREKAQACLRAARLAEEIVPFWHLQPHLECLHQREENEAYAAYAQRKNFLLVYFPLQEDLPSVEVDLQGFASPLRISWLNVDKGQMAATQLVVHERRMTLQPPASGNWVAIFSGPTK